MLKKIRSIMSELKYLFINHIICNIPIWFIRKWLYEFFGTLVPVTVIKM